MPRELHAIIAHIRAVSANPSISTTLIQTEDLEVLCSAAEGNPPETRAAEEWISRDDHIAAIEAIRAEYMQRLLGSEPRAVEALAKAVLDRDAQWAPSGDSNDCNCINLSREAEREYETGKCPHQRLRAILALPHNPAATSEGGK